MPEKKFELGDYVEVKNNPQAALYAALAKAQAAFPAIPREKEVTVTTKTGGSYKFKYAPLETIMAAVREPLATNGLSIVQLLDDGDLVTSLLHEEGGALSGRCPIPAVEGIQAFGSAITYLRRYAIVAALGIATEEDDDGNHAAGNTATFGRQTAASLNAQERERFAKTDTGIPIADYPDGIASGLIGTAIAQGTQDFELRQGPEGYTLPFRVKNGSKSFIVLAEGKLAEALSVIRPTVEGQRVTVWGHWTDETIPAKGNKPQINYRVLHLERIETPDGMLPPAEPVEPVEAESAALFTGPEFDRATA